MLIYQRVLIPSTKVLRYHQEDDSWSVEATDFWYTSVADIVGEFLRFDPCFGWLNHQPNLDLSSVQKATRSMIPIDVHSFAARIAQACTSNFCLKPAWYPM